MVQQMELEFIKPLLKQSDSKIVLLVMDGLGGLPLNPSGLTELETAKTPHLDLLAKEGICGLQLPVGSGITPGSGPGHLALFGYNPRKYTVGRGILSANGIGFPIQPGDVTARGNFCTIDGNGIITDRRAGRIPSEKNKELCEVLRDNISLPGVEIFIETEKEYRFVLVLRGEGLSAEIHDTDPQEVGKKPLHATAFAEKAQRTADIVNNFLQQTQRILHDHHPANMVLLRGFSTKPDWPTMQESFGVHAAAIAAYPMYRGLAGLLGMDILQTGETIQEEFETLKQQWNNYDFFYVHIKKTDSSGEDGNFDKKVEIIEQVDHMIPQLRELNPAVIIVTGDHSTPALHKAHSWHPVPVLLWSKLCRTDFVKEFGERACVTGALGPRFPAEDLLPLALANAERLEKFGA